MPLSSFVQMFTSKFNETLPDRLIKAMKHAIEIQYVNDMKCVTITKLMRFIIHIVNVIESRGIVKIKDLPSLLKVSVKACFPFGYPNLITFMQAFPDVFIYTPSKTNAFRGDFKVNGQCILTKEGYANFIKFTIDSNNNQHENNNESDAINYNKKNNSPIDEMSNDGYLSMSGSEMVGATSLAYQASMRSSSFGSSSGNVGSIEMNVHPAYDNINTFSTENSVAAEGDARCVMNSTKITNESFESFEKGAQKSFEMSLNNMSNGDDKENSGFYNNSKADIEKHLSSFCCCHRDNNMSANVENMEIDRSFNGKDSNSNRKRAFCTAPKPDTPPTAPYWNNPIWGGENCSPPMNLSLELPELKVTSSLPKLNTPQVMGAIAKKSRFIFDNQLNAE